MRGRSLEQPQIASVLQATPGAACAEARTATNEATMTAKTEQQVPESILHPVLLPLHFQSASEIGVTSSRDTGARTDLDAALALPRLAASLRQGKRRGRETEGSRQSQPITEPGQTLATFDASSIVKQHRKVHQFQPPKSAPL